MIYIAIVLLILSSIGMMSGVIMLIRNNMVYKVRTSVLHDENYTRRECLDRLGQLPEYNEMIMQFTKWKKSHWIT